MHYKWIRITTVALGAFVLAGIGAAGEKKLMHCFAFTSVEDASEADWEAFYKATDDLPEKIDGLNKVWYGKLRRPMRLYYKTGGEEATYEQRIREWSVCMEMADIAALEKYADHPSHREWEEAYFKVRQRGTTTFDILGQ